MNLNECSSVKEDDLDYDSPYWVSLDEEKELITQLNKLKIQSTCSTKGIGVREYIVLFKRKFYTKIYG